MTGRNENMTFLFEDILKYIGKPKGNEDMHQGLEEIFNQFENWEDSNSSQPPFDWSKLSLGDRIDPSMTHYTNIRTALLATILICSSVFGVAVNIYVTVTAILNYRQLQATRVVLVVNLCLACLLFLIGGMPLLLMENVFGYGWNHGETACQLHRYIVYGSFYLISYSTVLLLLHVTLTMWFPLRLGKLDKPINAFALCCILWALISLCNIPNYLGHGVSDEIPGISFCYHKEIQADLGKVRAWTTLQFSFTFAVPILMMSALTLLTLCRVCGSPREYAELHDVTNSRRELAMFQICLTATFLVCWLPDKVLALYLAYQDTSKKISTNFLLMSDLMMCLAYSNPSINPILTLVCTLRQFLLCKHSRNQPSSTQACGSQTGQTAENVDSGEQSNAIINPGNKLIISVV